MQQNSALKWEKLQVRKVCKDSRHEAKGKNEEKHKDMYKTTIFFTSF